MTHRISTMSDIEFDYVVVNDVGPSYQEIIHEYWREFKIVANLMKNEVFELVIALADSVKPNESYLLYR